MKTNTALKIVTLCVICAATLMSGCIVVESNEPEVVYITQTPETIHTTPETIHTNTATTSVASQWHDVATWSGTGTKNTETFTIPKRAKEWRISWDTKPDPTYGDFNFQIYVYKSSGSMIAVAANVIGENVDSTIMRTSGDHYLTINTAQPYTIIVEAKY